MTANNAALEHTPLPDSSVAGSAPIRRIGDAWHRRVAGLHVIKVKGSFYDMGYQHGALLKDAVAAGPVPYYRGFSERLLGRSLFGPLSPLLWPPLQRMIGARVARGIPEFAREGIRGLAAGSGVPHDVLMDGCTMPDSMLWLVARYFRLIHPGPAVGHRVALGLGCTSAIAWGDATRDGKLLHARNFDYHGVSTWARNATIVFHEPDDGQRYVSVAAAGVIGGGITAMNEAGLTLTVHQHMFTDTTRFGGTTIGLTGDTVMREATTLEQAEAILGSQRPIGCWTYVIADGKRREVLCWEESPQRHVAIRIPSAEKNTFGYSNIYLDPQLGSTEVNAYGSYWRHNEGRYRRANELLTQRTGELDPAAMASIIGDTGDPRCRVRDSIAMALTVGSVVFRPEDGVFWVGTGEAPTSRGTFVPFELGREDYAPDHGELITDADEPTASREAFERFRRAYIAYVDEHDLTRARAETDAARSLAPEQALYHALAGLYCLEDGDPRSGEAAFDAAIGRGHPDPERVAAFHLWRARARDILGERDRALADYRMSLGHPADPPVRRAALRGLRRPYSARRARRIHVDVGFVDVVAP